MADWHTDELFNHWRWLNGDYHLTHAHVASLVWFPPLNTTVLPVYWVLAAMSEQEHPHWLVIYYTRHIQQLRRIINIHLSRHLQCKVVMDLMVTKCSLGVSILLSPIKTWIYLCSVNGTDTDMTPLPSISPSSWYAVICRDDDLLICAGRDVWQAGGSWNTLRLESHLFSN